MGIITTFSKEVRKMPHALSELIIGLFETMELPNIKIIVLYKQNQIDELEKEKEKLASLFLPFKTIIFWNIENEEESKFWDENIDYLKNPKLLNDSITFMVCKDFSCQLPTNKFENLIF
jgi:uncharacterized protein YyaL (SSP411 family)